MPYRMPSVMRDVGYLVVNTQDIFANAMQVKNFV